MTETEREAQALLNEVRAEYPLISSEVASNLALRRAIEQHEAFKLEVSDAVEKHKAGMYLQDTALDRFIIAKQVDPFVALVGEAVWNDPNEPDAVDCAASILAALAARGLKIVEVGHD